jgi:hypothetical protein
MSWGGLGWFRSENSFYSGEYIHILEGVGMNSLSLLRPNQTDTRTHTHTHTYTRTHTYPYLNKNKMRAFPKALKLIS